MTSKCPIWDTPAKEIALLDIDALQFDSPRAGGKYQITGSALAVLLTATPKHRALLTTWLVDQRRGGNPSPEIDSSVIDRAKKWVPLTVEEKRDRFLLCLESMAQDISHSFRLAGTVDTYLIELRHRLAAWTECLSDSEVMALRRFVAQAGLIEGDTNVSITFDGWRHIENTKHKTTASAQGFIAMWFHPSMDAVYRQGIEPAITESGYRPMRIDRKEYINKVDDEIVAEIRRSRFVVADFTSDPDKPRGGVYFEAGFAMGLTIPVFWTCRADLIDQVHFDTRQFNHICWDTPSVLRVALRNRIEAVLGQGPIANRLHRPAGLVTGSRD